ncbi:hypothetical protein H2201_004719 [Coniosporium apollinis]|uniref:Uncharacterized protein n=1 Tax=Coniosporium apollinis TaxID=61459 RepID=A0ABQ9NVB4_9PEZI|nr:hypothetical protein H2201_004719 [Coniosporium apollinis]
MLKPVRLVYDGWGRGEHLFDYVPPGFSFSQFETALRQHRRSLENLEIAKKWYRQKPDDNIMEDFDHMEFMKTLKEFDELISVKFPRTIPHLHPVSSLLDILPPLVQIIDVGLGTQDLINESRLLATKDDPPCLPRLKVIR